MRISTQQIFNIIDVLITQQTYLNIFILYVLLYTYQKAITHGAVDNIDRYNLYFLFQPS